MCRSIELNSKRNLGITAVHLKEGRPLGTRVQLPSWFFQVTHLGVRSDHTPGTPSLERTANHKIPSLLLYMSKSTSDYKIIRELSNMIKMLKKWCYCLCFHFSERLEWFGPRTRGCRTTLVSCPVALYNNSHITLSRNCERTCILFSVSKSVKPKTRHQSG